MPYPKDLKTLPKVMYYTKAARFWEDGNGFSFSLRVWHPISWLIIFIFLPLQFLGYGAAEFRRSLPYYGVGLSKHWQKNKDKRKFF